jgi:hypothetical protein
MSVAVSVDPLVLAQTLSSPLGSGVLLGNAPGYVLEALPLPGALDQAVDHLRRVLRLRQRAGQCSLVLGCYSTTAELSSKHVLMLEAVSKLEDVSKPMLLLTVEHSPSISVAVYEPESLSLRESAMVLFRPVSHSVQCSAASRTILDALAQQTASIESHSKALDRSLQNMTQLLEDNADVEVHSIPKPQDGVPDLLMASYLGTLLKGQAQLADRVSALI